MHWWPKLRLDCVNCYAHIVGFVTEQKQLQDDGADGPHQKLKGAHAAELTSNWSG